MKTLSCLALSLVTACVEPSSELGPSGGGKADDPNATFGDLVTEWELRVGLGGDAVMKNVAVLPDGKLLATSHFPNWIKKVSADGELDRSFGDMYGGSRTGTINQDAFDAWPVGTSALVASVGDINVRELHRYRTADGTLDPAFGTAGKLTLPYTSNGDLTIAVEHDVARDRFVALVVRAWAGAQSSDYARATTVELLAYDAQTGAVSSLGAHQMPAWQRSAKLHELVLRPDGSHVVLVSEQIDIYADDNVSLRTALDWYAMHLSAGQPPALVKLATTDYISSVTSFASLPDGGFDVYLSGTIHGISATEEDDKLIRVSVDSALHASIAVLAPGFPYGITCHAAAATPTHLVLAHAPDRSQPIQLTAYSKSGGAPIAFTSDLARRCPLFLRITPGGDLYASTWDTTETAWKALITRFAPE